MGKAIIIPVVDWGMKNLGQVTRLGGLVITGASTTHGEDVVLTSSYNGNPVTAQWLVTSNNATIVISGSTCTVTPTGTAPANIAVQATFAGSTATKTVSLVETHITDIDGQVWLDENAITLTAKNNGTTVSDAVFALTGGSDLATIIDNGNGTATLTAKTTGAGGLVTITASKGGDTIAKQVRVYVMANLFFHLDGSDVNGASWTDRKQNLAFSLPSGWAQTSDGKGLDCNGAGYSSKSSTNNWPDFSNGGTVEFSVKPRTSSKGQFVFRPEDKNNSYYCLVQYSSVRDKMVFFSGTNVATGFNKWQTTPLADCVTNDCLLKQSFSLGKFNGSTFVTQPLNIANENKLTVLTDDPTMDTAAGSIKAYFLLGLSEADISFNGLVFQIRLYTANLTESQMLNNQAIDDIRYGSNS